MSRLFVFVTLCLVVNEYLVVAVVLNKCCDVNQKLNNYAQCVNNTVLNNENDKFWWVPRPFGETDLDYLNLLKSKGLESVSYGWSHRHSCPGSREVLKYFHQGDEYDFHFDLVVVNNDIYMNVSKESAYHDPADAVQHEMPSSVYCVDYHSENTFIAIMCPCERMPCVRKCCPDNTAYKASRNQTMFEFNKKYCVDEKNDDLAYWTPQMDLSLTEHLKYYRLINTTPHCQRIGHIFLKENSKLVLLADGSIQVSGTQSKYSANTYCGENTVEGGELLLLCLNDDDDKNMTLYGVLFVIGAVALFLTIFLALLLPDMRRNIHGRMTLAHNVMLFIGYVILGVIMIKGRANDMTMKTCKITSFIMQFTLLSAFFWLNVMCIDIAWVFSGLRPIRGSASQRDTKKLILYSLYAWGTTSIIVIATAIVEFDPDITRFKPSFGLSGGSCFFNDRSAMLVFFYGPMSVLLIVNFILFVYTAAKIIAIKRETAILQSSESSSNKKNKQRLLLYGKLFCLMGITWMFEVISWAMDSRNGFFIFTDILNLLRGVFIFIIFCCKKKVYYQTRNKFLRLLGKEVPADSGYFSSRDTRHTTSSSISSKSHVPVTPVAPRVTFNRQESTLSIEMNKV